ncbi:MAG: Ig-like domain-containing protein [Eubacteriales bacterium]|nr:Ig-like domain-containing protein [Eubacteriales bacterium]
MQPRSATNKTMSWTNTDESIATVKGTTNRFKVTGQRWGRCKITGTTEDGGFTVEIYTDVGTLRHAVTVSDVSIKDGKPYVKLKNHSDMNISQVRFEMLGYDNALQPVVMSLTNDQNKLQGTYDMPLAEGESTTHGQFTFYRPSDDAGLAILQFTVTGWSTDTGYYDRNGKLQYNYNIDEEQWEWVTYPANTGSLDK